jgi:hypothetical protein
VLACLVVPGSSPSIAVIWRDWCLKNIVGWHVVVAAVVWPGTLERDPGS